MKPKGITEPQRRALEAMKDGREYRPGQIARILWPDSPGWKRRSRRSSTPAGGALGATMPMIAGRLLSNLWRAGLVRTGFRDSYAYQISEKGKAALEGESES